MKNYEAIFINRDTGQTVRVVFHHDTLNSFQAQTEFFKSVRDRKDIKHVHDFECISLRLADYHAILD